MPRQNDGTELFKKIRFVDDYRLPLAGGDTTTTAALERDDTVIPVTSATSFAVNDPIFIIGDGGWERNEVGAIAGLNVTPKWPVRFAHTAGARVVESVRVPLGLIEESGFSLTPSRTDTSINAANSDVAVATIEGVTETSFGFGLLGNNGPNFQMWYGLAEDETGAGTAADPYTVSVGGSLDVSAGLRMIVGGGVRHDGRLFTYDLAGAVIAPSGTKTLGRGGASAYPMSGRTTHIVYREWAA